MHKYSISIGLIMILFIWFSYAQRQGNGDCEMVQGWNITFLDISSVGNSRELITEEVITRASMNLRAYCCEQKILRDDPNTPVNQKVCQERDIPANKYFPQSEYLFDHLVDIMFRRLDGNPELIYPDVPLHPRGEAWRKKIREYAVVPEGKFPIELINAALDDRVSPWLGPDDDSLLLLYNRVCDVAYGYYTSLAWSKSSPGAETTTKVYLDICPKLTQSIVQYELMYIRVIIDLLANRTLWHSMTTYLKDYYANNRLVTLQSTINEMVGAFTTVNRFYVEWTKQCSM